MALMMLDEAREFDHAGFAGVASHSSPGKCSHDVKGKLNTQEKFIASAVPVLCVFGLGSCAT